MSEGREEKEPRVFAFRVTREKLRESRDMSPEAKLRWLEEANQFVRTFVGLDRLERWKERQRRG